MNKTLYLILFSLILTTASSQESRVKFMIETPYGTMTGELYNETPAHRDNFVKLVNEGWYEDSPFHRVIKDFMIQGGGNKDGRNDPGYKVPAEFIPEKYIHKKGALAAARMGDQANPTKASSGSQFYICQGKPVSDEMMNQIEQKMNQGVQGGIIREYITRPENNDIYKCVDSLQRARDREGMNEYMEKLIVQMESEGIDMGGFKYTDEQRAVYRTLGGTPHLDGAYTVFGELTDGFDVIDKIAMVPTGGANKPLETVSMKIKIVE